MIEFEEERPKMERELSWIEREVPLHSVREAFLTETGPAEMSQKEEEDIGG
jgi:hypothetical protein